MVMQDDAIAIMRSADGLDGDPRSRLVLHGRETDLDLPGAVLEASLRFGDEFLLFLTDDVPFEEGLHICLIDASGGLLDRVDLLAMYATGTLRDMQPLADGRVNFRFFDGPLMQVRVLPMPKLMLPSIGLVSGISRAFSARGRLVVTRLKTSSSEGLPA